MKLQYLGDSKDCFKWDYHDFLTREMNYDIFNVVFMLTPDDDNNHGRSKASEFPASQQLVNFCETLKSTREPKRLSDLPRITSSPYSVEFHRLETCFDHPTRYQYFSGISYSEKQIVFLDPDNGFEPEKSISEKHVAYQDVFRILDQTPNGTLLSVFQNPRRIRIHEDYARIQERLHGLPTTAIQWSNKLIFVGISKSEEVIRKAREVNLLYANKYSDVSIL